MDDKRPRPRACDYCRRRKIRCNVSSSHQKNVCSSCTVAGVKCTFEAPNPRRFYSKTYTSSLENRAKLLAQLVEKYVPPADIEEQLGSLVELSEPTNRPSSSALHLADAILDKPWPPGKLNHQVDAWYRREYDSESDYDDAIFDTDDIMLLDWGDDHRFYGKSSSAYLIHTAHELKEAVDGSPTRLSPTSTDEWSTTNELKHSEMARERECLASIVFPPADLMEALIHLFVRHVSPIAPIIDISTLEEQYTSGLYLRDLRHARLLLMVCALGSIYSKDPRVLYDVQGRLVPGYEYFFQLRFWRCPYQAVQLHELQTCALIATYYLHIGDPLRPGYCLGMGFVWAKMWAPIARAQAEASYGIELCGGSSSCNTDAQSFHARGARRYLVTWDRMISRLLGRNCAIQEEEITLNLPTPQREESVETADTIIFFAHFAKLGIILSLAIRILHTIRKPGLQGTANLPSFFGPEWQAQTSTELSNSLSQWLNEVPDHLRWDPHRKNILHFEQSAYLYYSYHYVAIFLNRPFNNAIRDPSGRLQPGFERCIREARACSQLLSIVARRSIINSYGSFVTLLSGTVLLTAIWTSRTQHPDADVSDLEDSVHRCLSVLQVAARPWKNGPNPGDSSAGLTSSKERWTASNRHLVVLQNLALSGGVSFPEPDVGGKVPPADVEHQQWHRQHYHRIDPSVTGMGQRVHSTPTNMPFAAPVVSVPGIHLND
ncbi:hypothetical protein BS47DRAFT_1481125, partial [Hydnum rufescens UP504]